MEPNDKIDFVITWVDGGDKEWQKERNKYAGKNPEDIADYRFRDWDNLKYWFRGVEKYAPWVNNIYFVTNGQKPDWLNVNHPKLKWVKHEEFIPKEYLPTFNSHTIEHNLYRIKGLSEKFVYFNDDIFLIDKVNQSDFFKDGLPKVLVGLECIAMPNETFGHILLNDAQLINRHFDIKKVINKKWYSLKNGIKNITKTLWYKNYCCFTGLVIPHTAYPLRKTTLEKIWNLEHEWLDETCKHKFRDTKDVNQYIYTWYEIANNTFENRSYKMNDCYDISNDNSKIIKNIELKRHKIICINDTSNDFDFESAKKQINSAFEMVLPDKSKFEI